MVESRVWNSRPAPFTSHSNPNAFHQSLQSQCASPVTPIPMRFTSHSNPNAFHQSLQSQCASPVTPIPMRFTSHSNPNALHQSLQSQCASPVIPSPTCFTSHSQPHVLHKSLPAPRASPVTLSYMRFTSHCQPHELYVSTTFKIKQAIHELCLSTTKEHSLYWKDSCKNIFKLRPVSQNTAFSWFYIKFGPVKLRTLILKKLDKDMI